MNIEVKKSKKPIKYEEAINFMESKIHKVNENTANELIWTLEHNEIFTAGTSFKENEILDKSIKIIRTNRGGKITYHGPGQLICYFIIDLKKRGKDIRKFISIIEKTANELIWTLEHNEIYTAGTSFKENEILDKSIKIIHKEIKKVAAIGVRVRKWIAYHGFSININNKLDKYDAIIPCGISNRGVTNLKTIVDQNYDELENKLIENFLINLKS